MSEAGAASARLDAANRLLPLDSAALGFIRSVARSVSCRRGALKMILFFPFSLHHNSFSMFQIFNQWFWAEPDLFSQEVFAPAAGLLRGQWKTLPTVAPYCSQKPPETHAARPKTTTKSTNQSESRGGVSSWWRGGARRFGYALRTFNCQQ